MIREEDRPTYIRLVSDLTTILLKDELIEAKRKNNDYNDLATSGKPLGEEMQGIYDLAFDIINAASSKFDENLEIASTLETVPESLPKR